MAKAKKERTETPATASKDKTVRVVLVGTYRGGQLTKWPGWYNWPVPEMDFNAETQRRREGLSTNGNCHNCPQITNASSTRLNPVNPVENNLGASAALRENLSAVTELWLFRGTKEQKTFKAEFVGIKTREELIRDYGYPGDGVFNAEAQRRREGGSQLVATENADVRERVPPKPHGARYALFKTTPLYRTESDLPGEADRVIIRTADFAKRSPQIAKQLKAYLESPDRKDPALAKRLPSILTRLRPDRLRVCEQAVQLDLFQEFSQSSCASPKNVWDKDVEVERSSYAWTKRPVLFRRQKKLAAGKINVLELFCGCGGTSCGFEMAGYQTEMGIDILEPAIETFRLNHKTASAYLGDIKNISAEEIMANLPEKVCQIG